MAKENRESVSFSEKMRIYLDKKWKWFIVIVLSVTAVAMVASWRNYSPHSESKPPVSLSRFLSSHAKPRLQSDGEQMTFDVGVAMDPEIRDCSSETHWKKTFSDLDYSLIGYDILFGYPLANGRDPGFRQPIFTANYSKPKQTADCRHVIPQGFTVIPSESCVVSFDSKLIHNKQQMSIHLGVQASVKGGGFGYEFSASAGFNTDAAEMSSGDFLYIISQAVCQNYYSVIDFTNPPPFDPGFISKAETLVDPESGDEAVLEFIKYYGTHFMTQATYGAKFVQHHKVSQTTFESLKRSEFSVETQANYAGLISVGGGISLDSDQKKAASNFFKQVQTTTYTVGSTPPSNGDAMTWAASVKQNPVPMQYTLSPIDLLFTEPFVKELPPGFDYTAVRQKLKNSSQLYCQALKQQGMVHSCEDYFQLETQGVDIYEPGYSFLQNIDYSTCLAFCRQDENCTCVVYSQLNPPFTGSVCRFFNKTTNLTLINPSIYDIPRQSNLIILKSRQNAYYINADLEGKPFSVREADQNTCNWSCSNKQSGFVFFCDAYSYVYGDGKRRCSLYSEKDITNITYTKGSYVRM